MALRARRLVHRFAVLKTSGCSIVPSDENTSQWKLTEEFGEQQAISMKSPKAKRDKILRPDRDWWNNAFVWHESDAYATGYRRAGEILVAHVVDSSRDQDTLLFPIVFVYRHALELLMKEIISSGRMLLDERSPAEPLDHNLDRLLSTAITIIDRIWPDDEHPSELDLTKQVISELTQHDRTSEVFRYPKTKKNKLYLTQIQLVNLRHFGEQLKTCCDFLDGVVSGIHDHLDMKYEAMRYQRDGY
jgi:hypothetical protein